MARLRGHSGLTDRGLVRGASAPSGAAIGQMWFNTGTGVLYQRTSNVDGSSFWLDISSGGIGTSADRGVDYVGDTDPLPNHNGGSATLSVGQVYYNRELNRHFVCTDATSGANVWSGRYAGAGGIVTTVLLSSTYYRIHTFKVSGTFYVEDPMNVDILVVAGGGSGGAGYGGGGGAGGLIYKTGHALTVNGVYDMVIGDGGAGQTGLAALGNNGADTTVTINGGAVQFTAKGGGGGGSETSPFEGKDGGSGGGNSYGPSNPGLATQGSQGGDSGTYGFGYNGGVGSNTGWTNAGGGGAGSVGQNANVGDSDAGDGGAGKDMSAIFGTGVGDSGWFASGGGGGKGDVGGGGSASNGGGGDGGNTDGTTGTAGAANTGGGSGGAARPATTDSTPGGSGVVIIRYALN